MNDLVATDEYEPGRFRTVSIPDPMVIAVISGAACLARQWGTLGWLEYGGHELNLLVA